MRYLILLTLFLSLPVFAQQLVTPSDRVTNHLNIRSTPSSDIDEVGELEPGETAPLIDSDTAGWHKIQFNDEEAFVSKSWSIVIDGPGDTPAGDSSITYTLDVIDVGTGLSIFVTAPDFNLLYDAGSNDDARTGDKNRVVAFLKKIYPDVKTINHMMLSHPHKDHNQLLPDIIREWTIENVWDSGAMNNTCGYQAFVGDVAKEVGVMYHTALNPKGSGTVKFDEAKKCLSVEYPVSFDFNFASQVKTKDIVELGQGASMQFMYAPVEAQSNINENSLVIMLTLGTKKILFTGDSEGGARGNWESQAAPESSSVEAGILECCTDLLKADIHIAGHHGSLTSSRRDYLDAVGAKLFIVSAGPKKYGSVVLPDQPVIDALEERGKVYRTDIDDTACKTSTDKIGENNDGKAGGCSNWRFTIGSEVTVSEL